LKEFEITFLVRTEIMKKILSDPKWSKKLDKAKTVDDVAEIIADFCRAKGYKIVKTNCSNCYTQKKGREVMLCSLEKAVF